MSISIERAVPEDAERLVRVQIAAFHYDSELYPGVETGGPPGYDSVPHMLEKIERDECYIILDAGRCIGGLVLFDKGNGHYHLDVIFIDPAYQNRGIGSQAIQFIEQVYPANCWIRRSGRCATSIFTRSLVMLKCANLWRMARR